jgi:hypothetical protein
MDLLGLQLILNTARNKLAGAGTQTAALGFGGNPPTTGATEEYDGTILDNFSSKFRNSKIWFRRSRNTSISIRFWWLYRWYSTATEEFTITGTVGIKTVTVS